MSYKSSGYKRRSEHDLNLPSSSLTYIQSNLNLMSLVTRRELIDVSFMSKLLKGTIAYPEFLHLFNIYIPTFHSRTIPIIKIPLYHTSYGSNNSIDRISLLCNRLNNFDVFT